MEFYKAYADDLAPGFHAMLVHLLRKDTLLLTMSEAVIVVVPKPGKDLEHCASYLISFLNVEKLLIVK